MELEFLESMEFYASAEQTYRLAADAEVRTVEQAGDFAWVSAYVDASGASISFMQTLAGLTTESFAVYGATPVWAHVWQVAPGLACADVGGVNATHAGKGATHAGKGATNTGQGASAQVRLLLSVDDPHLYPRYPLRAVGWPVRSTSFQLGAIASEVRVYDTVEEWAAHQTPVRKEDTYLKDVDDPSIPDELLIGPKFIASPLLGPLLQGRLAPADAGSNALFKGVVEGVEMVQNALTGRPWYKVAADCGVPVMVAMPATADPKPKIGGVIDGEVFMTGTSGTWLR
ncbi:hypothetical protein [Corynebacterium glucuronolyticum]|nr:hypothetical protein [Corynebacterium glucuronolyticum]WKD62369.1 hypothetical protein CGLUCO_00380 [Corynebacterium glucuronolyticum DSM 44120]SMB81972.1 hypothetical protein SAMN05660745_02526 [Corynebacterium glucuronolyticum]